MPSIFNSKVCGEMIQNPLKPKIDDVKFSIMRLEAICEEYGDSHTLHSLEEARAILDEAIHSGHFDDSTAAY